MKKIVLPLVLIFMLMSTTIAFAAGLLSLPAYQVTVSHGSWNQGVIGGTIDITLSNVGDGYDVADGTYPGWCIEDNFQDDFDGLVTLYDSTDTNLPANISGPWDKVNYLLNHKNGTPQEVQAAIWLLLGGYSYTFPVTPSAQAMYNDAMANGSGFLPGPGQIFAVIIYSDGFGAVGAQDTVIEVTIPPDNDDPGTGTPGYWKNHPEAWPVDSITIGEQTFTKEQAIDLMTQGEAQTGKSADKSLTLFRAYVAAYLNGLIGNNTSCIDSTMDAAYDWLDSYNVGSQTLSKSAAWKAGEPLYLTLDDYNNGLLCAPARD